MLSSAVRKILRRLTPRPAGTIVGGMPAAASETPAAAEEKTTEPPVRTAWPAIRLNLANELWGPGFIFPGGEPEALRLLRPLGLSSASSLLVVGVGSGGPASTAARNFGAYITGLDTDPSLLAAARGLISRSQLRKKVTIEAWDPAKPEFVPQSHHHCLALEPFNAAQPEPILVSLAKAVKPGGQIVLTALAAPTPLELRDATVRRWGRLEQRNPAELMAPVAVSRMMARVGLDVRIAEDISERHVEHTLLGWRVMLRELEDRKPTPMQAAQLVAEAELWLLRRRLIGLGKLRMVRWHAMRRTVIV